MNPSQRQTDRSVLASALLLFGAAGAIFLAGGAPQGNLGVFLLCAGSAMVICPPRFKPPRAVGWMATGLLGCGGTALLPRQFFPALTWRRVLAVVPDLPLPNTVSAAPTQTLFWLGILATTTIVGMFLLTQSVRSRSLLAVALGSAGICGVYAALSIFAKLSGWNYPFSGGATFGFLPNRNHTATFLITGSMLSLGVLVMAFRERRWLMADVVLAPLTLCIVGLFFFSASRAGVVFLVLGLMGWVAGLSGKHRTRSLLLAVAVTALVSIGLFLAVKSDARERLFGSVPTYEGATHAKRPPAYEITDDDRLKIYHDTLGIIREAPLTGTGLGTFELVFPPYRKALLNPALVLHPESDWLMLAAEMGLPACLSLGGLLFLLLRAWRPDRNHPYWPLRWSIFIAAAAGLLHGLVDVPSHRAALGWWLLVLAGLALQTGSNPKEEIHPSRRWAWRAFFVVAGLGSVVLGAWLVRAEWLGGAALPPFAAKQAQVEILRTFNHGNTEAAMELARRSVRAFPLAPPLYYQLGVLLLRFEDTDTEVDRAFLLQRLLNPLTPEVPRAQGLAWLPVDPDRAATLFVDALERQERMPRTLAAEGGDASYMRGLVQQAKGVAAVQNRLWDAAAARGPEVELAWLDVADSNVTKDRLAKLALEEAFLTRLDGVQRQRFLALWSQKGDPASLQVFLQGHGAEWKP